MKIVNHLNVFSHGAKVGELSRLTTPEKGDVYAFQYDENADIGNPISLLMPVRPEPYFSPTIHSVFESAMPEGYLAAAIVKRFGRAVLPDDMGILFITGHSRVGHIQCSESNDAPSPKIKTISPPDAINADQLSNYLERIMYEFGDQSGVSGTMPKVIAAKDARITTKDNASIIKFDAIEFPYISSNEYFCLMGARKAGIDVPDCELLMDGKGLSVKRFDYKKDNSDFRLGFEDACSLMSMKSINKYHASVEDFATHMARITNRRDDQVTLFKALVYSHVTRNGDAHLKNFGVLFDGYESIRLAPIYDLVTTTAYSQFKDGDAALPLRGSREWADKDALMNAARLRCFDISRNEVLSIFESISNSLGETSLEMIKFVDQHENARPVMQAMLMEWQKGLSMIEAPSSLLNEAVELLSSQSDAEKLMIMV